MNSNIAYFSAWNGKEKKCNFPQIFFETLSYQCDRIFGIGQFRILFEWIVVSHYSWFTDRVSIFFGTYWGSLARRNELSVWASIRHTKKRLRCENGKNTMKSGKIICFKIAINASWHTRARDPIPSWKKNKYISTGGPPWREIRPCRNFCRPIFSNFFLKNPIFKNFKIVQKRHNYVLSRARI